MKDERNVMDEFKHVPHDEIVDQLDARGVRLEVAVENTLRDFNMGTIVRTANAFGVRTVHVVGRRQWNKRGAMMTDKYLRVMYHDTPAAFRRAVGGGETMIYACENNVASVSLYQTSFVTDTVLIFGQEGAGISKELLAQADYVVSIDQLGSTRSMNVGVAAGIVMYEWSRQQNAQ